MTYPITQSFTKATKWGDETRAHPAMKWMEKFTKDAIDNLAYRSGCPYSDWYTDEFMLQKATGEVIYGGKKAWEEGITSIYAPFASHLHDPNFLSCIEREYGWEMIGQADVYANLHVPGPEPKVRDPSGKEWDVVTNSAFHFEYVKDSKAKHDGIKLKSTKIFCDSGPALMLMLKRGQLKPADLGL